jgi:hypothetical protein
MRNFTRSSVALLLLWFTCGLHANAQAPANDDPCGAVVLAPSGQLCTAPTVGTLVAATPTTPNGYSNQNTCGLAFGQPLDVWYKFTTTGSGLGSTGATISVTGNAAAQLRLFSAATCAGPFTQLDCQGSTAPNTAAPSISVATLSPNTTYYVRVATNTPGPFTICLTDGPGIPYCPPIAVSNPTYSNPDNTAATLTFTGGSAYIPAYTVTISRYDDINLIQVSRYTTTTVAPVVLTGLLVGHRYVVAVGVFCTGGGAAGGQRTFTVPPPNDEPCGAVPLLVGAGGICSPTPGTISGATPTTPNGYGPGCGAGAFPAGPGLGHDVWYTFQTAPSGPASTSTVLTVDGTAEPGELRLFAAPTCSAPMAEVGCAVAQAGQLGPLTLVATNLLPNTRYYASVYLIGSPSYNIDFTICATVVPPTLACPTISRLVVAPTLIRPTTAALAIVLPSTARQPQSYTITYTPSGGAPTTITYVPVIVPGESPTSTYTILTGLQPTTTYAVSVVANCAGGAQSAPATISFTTAAGTIPNPGPPPANDNCATAQVLSVGTTCVSTPGTTLDATVSAPGVPVPDCISNSNPADVWYRLVIPASGTVEVRLDSVAGSSLRGKSLTFYTGSCNNLTQLQCFLGDSGDNIDAWTGGTPGSTLYVRVWALPLAGSLYAVNGPFTICALDSPLPCPQVTGVTVSAVTTTTASVAFVPGASNIGFSVTATPIGGGPAVQEADATSPISLTGLQPSTAYLVTVASICSGTELGPGVQATFTTLTPPVTCPAPTAFYVGSITGTSANVNFVPQAGTTYVLTYTRVGGTAQSLPVTTSPVALTGLLPNTTYTVTLQATCAVGPAPLVSTSFTTTSGCAAPLFLTATAVNSTAATIVFTAPSGSNGYLATLTPAGGTAQAIAPAPVASPFTITGLLPGTGYTVALQSACAGSPVSATETVRFVTLTPLATCATATGVTVTSLGGTTATVTFTGPSGAVGYTATATPATGSAVVAVSGATSPLLLTGLVPGTAYTVALTTNCGAGVGSVPTSGTGFTTPLASRNAALAAQVGLFPNPASRTATLTVPAALRGPGASVQLLNALGQVVRRQLLAATADTALDLSGLPTGFYSLQLASPEGPLVKRLVVE